MCSMRPRLGMRDDVVVIDQHPRGPGPAGGRCRGQIDADTPVGRTWPRAADAGAGTGQRIQASTPSMRSVMLLLNSAVGADRPRVKAIEHRRHVRQR